MRGYRRHLFLLSLSSVVLCSFVPYKDKQYIDHFLHVYSADLFRQKQFNLVSLSVSYGWSDISHIEMTFSCYRTLTQKDARKLLIETIDGILKKINNDPLLIERKLLSKGHFCVNQLKLEIKAENIFAQCCDADSVMKETILEDGEITYKTYRSSPYMSTGKKVFKESYRDAVLLVARESVYPGNEIEKNISNTIEATKAHKAQEKKLAEKPPVKEVPVEEFTVLSSGKRKIAPNSSTIESINFLPASLKAPETIPESKAPSTEMLPIQPEQKPVDVIATPPELKELHPLKTAEPQVEEKAKGVEPQPIEQVVPAAVVPEMKAIEPETPKPAVPVQETSSIPVQEKPSVPVEEKKVESIPVEKKTPSPAPLIEEVSPVIQQAPTPDTPIQKGPSQSVQKTQPVIEEKKTVIPAIVVPASVSLNENSQNPAQSTSSDAEKGKAVSPVQEEIALVTESQAQELQQKEQLAKALESAPQTNEQQIEKPAFDNAKKDPSFFKKLAGLVWKKKEDHSQQVSDASKASAVSKEVLEEKKVVQKIAPAPKAIAKSPEPKSAQPQRRGLWEKMKSVFSRKDKTAIQPLVVVPVKASVPKKEIKPTKPPQKTVPAPKAIVKSPEPKSAQPQRRGLWEKIKSVFSKKKSSTDQPVLKNAAPTNKPQKEIALAETPKALIPVKQEAEKGTV
ncbi:MAG: hypothetical protein JWO53_1261, partial [Chlamydiia bacterium]|nr:hypothetical protein [Chlamydiia bacterium]